MHGGSEEADVQPEGKYFSVDSDHLNYAELEGNAISEMKRLVTRHGYTASLRIKEVQFRMAPQR